jgi:hypothetical protein
VEGERDQRQHRLDGGTEKGREARCPQTNTYWSGFHGRLWRQRESMARLPPLIRRVSISRCCSRVHLPHVTAPPTTSLRPDALRGLVVRRIFVRAGRHAVPGQRPIGTSMRNAAHDQQYRNPPPFQLRTLVVSDFASSNPSSGETRRLTGRPDRRAVAPLAALRPRVRCRASVHGTRAAPV